MYGWSVGFERAGRTNAYRVSDAAVTPSPTDGASAERGQSQKQHEHIGHGDHEEIYRLVLLGTHEESQGCSSTPGSSNYVVRLSWM